MTSIAAAASLSGVPVVGRVMSNNNNNKENNTMSAKSTITEPTKADKLAERAKRTAERATERQAKAEAERVKAEKLAAAAEAEAAKQAEREAAEAVKRAEAERQAEATEQATENLAEVVKAEGDGLVSTVIAAWHLGDTVATADLKARPVAIAAMGEEAWQELQAEHAEAFAEGRVKSKQAQPRNLSKVNDSVNVRKVYGTVGLAEQAARDWLATDPASVSLRSFAKGESVNKAKGKGDPMTAKAAAGLFAKAVAREGLTEEQAMDLIAEAMASVAE